MKLSTRHFAQLLIDAAAWDSRYAELCCVQQYWLIENFVFGDNLCIHGSLEDRRRWDIPHVAGRHLYTRCG